MVYSFTSSLVLFWVSLDYWAGTVSLEARRGRDKVSVFQRFVSGIVNLWLGLDSSVITRSLGASDDG